MNKLSFEKIDMCKDNTPMSTGYNNVNAAAPADLVSRSKEVLIFFRNADNIDGTIIKIEKENYIEKIKNQLEFDEKEILTSIDSISDKEDKRLLYLESALINIYSSDIYEIVPVFTNEEMLLREVKIMNIGELLHG